MKRLKHILFLLTIIFTSCSNNDDSQTLSEEAYDIHVVGFTTQPDKYKNQATYWKNNIPTLLDQSDSESTATAVVVANNDVYISGSINHKACYWKNGNVVYLADGTEAYDIKVVNNDIYVAGENNYVACYWKNGEKTTLAEKENESRAYAITVIGNDIYIAGTHSIGRSQYDFQAYYWKNGKAKSIGNSGSASDIAVINNDLYIAGYDHDDFVNDKYRAYWINQGGLYVDLERNQNKIYTNGLAVYNSQIYAAGYLHSYGVLEPAYWEKGKTIKLSNTSGSVWSAANDIKATDNFIFICGYEQANQLRNKPKIWINNKETFLAGNIKEGEALGIFVVKNN